MEYFQQFDALFFNRESTRSLFGWLWRVQSDRTAPLTIINAGCYERGKRCDLRHVGTFAIFDPDGATHLPRRSTIDQMKNSQRSVGAQWRRRRTAPECGKHPALLYENGSGNLFFFSTDSKQCSASKLVEWDCEE
jgi:hypothetical protein